MMDISVTGQETTISPLMLEQICNILKLDTIESGLNDSKTSLYVSSGDCFIGIEISTIKEISESDTTYSIRSNNTWITIWKRVRHIHISIHI